jgi:hypothetical protein
MVVYDDGHRCRRSTVRLETSLDGLIDLPAHGKVYGLPMRIGGAHQHKGDEKQALSKLLHGP